MLNTAGVTVRGIYMGSVENMMCMMHGMMGGYGAPMCHSVQTMGTRSMGPGMPMTPMHMGMGMHSNNSYGHGDEDHDHDHMEACMNLVTLPHIVVTEIRFDGYIATPYR